MAIVANISIGTLVLISVVLAILYGLQLRANTANTNGYNQNNAFLEPEVCTGDQYADVVFGQFAKQSGTRCNQSGGEIGVGISSTKEGCAAMCDLDPSCIAWEWHISGQTCALSNECGRDSTIQDSDYDVHLKLSAIENDQVATPEGYQPKSNTGRNVVDKLRRRIARYLV